MPDSLADLNASIFAKTIAGQQEVASRSLGLTPLLRRLLIMVDGNRSAGELAPLVVGHDLADLFTQLQEKGCIELVRVVAAQPAPTASAQNPEAADQEAFLATLPPAETRTAKDVEMARNFMTNTTNTVFGQNTRFTLMEAIFACKTAYDTRRVYLLWAASMQASVIGSKRMSEFQGKIAQVL